MKKRLNLGIDIGSTTIKLVYLDEKDRIIYKRYERHNSDVWSTLNELLDESSKEVEVEKVGVIMTGSGALEIAEHLGVQHIQEVIACTEAVRRLLGDVSTVIELGGEDGKITFLGNSPEQRMNSSCAGGTGAFIDQMATLLKTDAQGLNELAKSYTTLYPIAARCGVFAKTDVQPLLNEGVRKEDIAASIFQAVVNQTITALACGRKIEGKVAFLGGPLCFLSELRSRFIETLKLQEGEVVIPERPELFVALGASIFAKKEEEMSFRKLIEVLKNRNESSRSKHLPALFKTEKEIRQFRERMARYKVARRELSSYEGKAYLGIDAGSTTTKIVLIAEDGGLLYSFYGSNKGEPISVVGNELMNLYDALPKGVTIVSSCATGYGEKLIKNTFQMSYGEVETIAHYKAAVRFCEDVDFILDIGGQDMKCMRIKDGVIQNVILNEACSSGCGSFIEMFCTSLGMDIDTFSDIALQAEKPVDLGTRCTVFMNSKVKEAQKEGAKLGDISAGLAYSVIKNALYKVIRIRNANEIKKVVVQGGTFHNDAILKCMEAVIEKEVVRPDICGLMGAYGAALIAMEKESRITGLLSKEQIENLKIEKKSSRCNRCENRCILTINKLADGRNYIYGNRCEKPLGISKVKENIPNMYDYKLERVFEYTPLKEEEAYRGTIGIPRVLNMYEDYPFWHTLLTKLGFRVQLSSKSSRKLYEMGINTIPSESVCYPAKLVHGHIIDLVNQGVKSIFYPCIPYEKKGKAACDNHYNCPIVCSYPEVIKNNIDRLDEEGIKLAIPFLNLESKQSVVNAMKETFAEYEISHKEVIKAVEAAYLEQERFKNDIAEKGEQMLCEIKRKGMKGIVVAGRPYHIDPEVNHGLTKLITEEGMAVFTEDSFRHRDEREGSLRVLNQWAYHGRLYAVANLVKREEALELMQLTSFGCGLDAITSEQVEEILSSVGKVYTMIKIDEVTSLGAIRIRIRSLKSALEERQKKKKDEINRLQNNRQEQEEKNGYTIFIPQMAPIHFEFLETAFMETGYKVKVLKQVCDDDVQEGLKYVNNDACYPAIIVIGQILRAIKEGEVDKDKVALLLTQTGGGCRASNYVALLRKALESSDLGHVPVIALSAQKIENQQLIKMNLQLIDRILMAILYGDLFMRMMNRVRPYECEAGATETLYLKWKEHVKQTIKAGKFKSFNQDVENIIKEFDQLPIIQRKRPRIGLVGEILVKFHPYANNNAVEIIEKEGGEAVVPDLLDFAFYSAYNGKFKYEILDKPFLSMIFGKVTISYLNYRRGHMIRCLEKSERFTAPHKIDVLAKKASKIISLGNQMGEGWFLTAEIQSLIEDGVENVVCMQPFGCLPNHVTGKGMIHPLKREYPDSNIMMIDYDPGASKVNQVNRIKLLMATAMRKMEEE